MAGQKQEGIPLGRRWDMQEEFLLNGALPNTTKPSKALKPKKHITKSTISDKTFEMVRKLKGKRS